MPKMSITVEKQSDPYYKCSFDIVERHEIEGATWEEVYVRYFKEWHNRYKYCNSVMARIDDEAHRQGYREYMKNPANYANAGGDMW